MGHSASRCDTFAGRAVNRRPLLKAATDQAAKSRQTHVGLPTELLDDIFSYLRPPARWDRGADKPNLLACSLVSRAWHHAALPHVFQFVLFRSCRLANTSRDSRDGEDVLYKSSRASLAAFRDFLAASPSISFSIRTLNLRACANLVLGRDPRRGTEEIRIDLLQSLLAVMPRLQHLILAGIHINASRPLAVPQERYRLQYLKLEAPDDQNYGDENGYLTPAWFLAILSLFEHIDSLELSNRCPTLGNFRRDSPLATTIASIGQGYECSLTSDTILFALHNVNLEKMQSLTVSPSVLACPSSLRARPLRSLGRELVHSGVSQRLVNVGFHLFWGCDAYEPEVGRLLQQCPNLQSLNIIASFQICDTSIDDAPHPFRAVLSREMWRWQYLCAFVSTQVPVDIQNLVLDIEYLYAIFRFATRTFDRGLSGHIGQEPSEAELALDRAMRMRFGQSLPVVNVRPRERAAFNLREEADLQTLLPCLTCAGLLHFQ